MATRSQYDENHNKESIQNEALAVKLDGKTVIVL